jgi:hypothetical protein
MTKELNLLFFLIWSTPTSLPMPCLAPRMTVFARTANTTQGQNRNDNKRGAHQTTLDQIRRHLSVTLDFDWLGLNAFGPDDLLHEITDHSRITTEFKLT